MCRSPFFAAPSAEVQVPTRHHHRFYRCSVALFRASLRHAHAARDHDHVQAHELVGEHAEDHVGVQVGCTSKTSWRCTPKTTWSCRCTSKTTGARSRPRGRAGRGARSTARSTSGKLSSAIQEICNITVLVQALKVNRVNLSIRQNYIFQMYDLELIVLFYVKKIIHNYVHRLRINIATSI